jgi:hypothetical protein
LTAVCSSMASPPSLGDQRFLVMDRKEEEEAKEMISLWKKQGKGREGREVILDKTRNHQAPLLPPTTPLLPVCATRLRIGLRFRCKTIQNHVSPFNYAGRRGRGNDVGPTRQQKQPTAVPFQFPFIVLLHG